MEHRWGQRLQVDFPVRITASRVSLGDGRLANLSVSGALLKAQLDTRVLCRVQIALIVPSRPSHEWPTVEAYVARKQRDGFGVEWCEFAPRTVCDILQRLILPHRATVVPAKESPKSPALGSGYRGAQIDAAAQKARYP